MKHLVRKIDSGTLSIWLPDDYKRQPIYGFSEWIAYLRNPANRRGVGYLHRVSPADGILRECCLGAKRTCEGTHWGEPSESNGSCTDNGSCADMGSPEAAYRTYYGFAALDHVGTTPFAVQWTNDIHLDHTESIRSLAKLNDMLPGESFEPIAWVIEQFWRGQSRWERFKSQIKISICRMFPGLKEKLIRPR